MHPSYWPWTNITSGLRRSVTRLVPVISRRWHVDVGWCRLMRRIYWHSLLMNHVGIAYNRSGWRRHGRRSIANLWYHSIRWNIGYHRLSVKVRFIDLNYNKNHPNLSKCQLLRYDYYKTWTYRWSTSSVVNWGSQARIIMHRRHWGMIPPVRGDMCRVRFFKVMIIRRLIISRR